MTDPWIQTNFSKGEKGNMLKYAAPFLKVKVPNASWVTGMLLQRNESGTYNLVQIEQSGGHNNPWTDKVVFEMEQIKNGKKVPMQAGDYKLIIRADKLGIQGMKDEFYIGDK